ncbi:MAG: transposase [Pseudomonadota bacterium]
MAWAEPAPIVGMKAHIGVDSKTKLAHSAAATAANEHNSQLLGDLLHGKERRVWGDSAYTGKKKRSPSTHRRRRITPMPRAIATVR